MFRVIFRSLVFFGLSWVPGIAVCAECDNAVSGEDIYVAISSDERGYRKQSDVFTQLVDRTVKQRAEEICKIAKCAGLTSFETEELDAENLIHAKIPRNIKTPELIFAQLRASELGPILATLLNPNLKTEPSFEERELKGKRPWVFGNNGSRRVGNAMWDLGHTLTFTSPLSVLTGPFVVIVAPVWAGTGGLVTTLSRAVERTPREITPEHALLRLANKKKINKIYDWFGKRVPHLIFKQVICQELPVN